MSDIPLCLINEDTIFHYTKIHTALEFILWDNVFKFFPKKNTDDPFEYHPPNIGIGASQNVSTEVGEPVRKKLQELLHNKSRVACFCKNDLTAIKDEFPFLDSYGFMKLRMWSQYGDKNRGVCLAFSRDKLIKELKNSLDDNSLLYAEDVSYHKLRDYRVNFHSIHADEVMRQGIERYALEYLKNHYQRLLFWKHFDYKDECEFRICFIPNNNNDSCKIDLALVGIILGDSYPTALLPSIKHLQDKYKTRLFRLDWRAFNYPQLYEI